jgi:hypothetical protein
MSLEELDDIPPEHAAGVQQVIDEIEAGAQCVVWDPEDFMRRYLVRFHKRQIEATKRATSAD